MFDTMDKWVGDVTMDPRTSRGKGGGNQQNPQHVSLFVLSQANGAACAGCRSRTTARVVNDVVFVFELLDV